MTRAARSLDVLLAQINALAPHRSKVSDGGLGDAAHASRVSDHNPVNGVYHARDFTHDPLGGFDAYHFAEVLRQAKDDRIKYVISNRKIFSGAGEGQVPWVWRPYHGTNPHDHHTHVSVKMGAKGDEVTLWKLDMAASTAPAPVKPTYPPLLMNGSKDGPGQSAVHELQTLLNNAGAHLILDGDFGNLTEKAVRAYQKAHGLTVDGLAGPYTMEALKAPTQPVTLPTPQPTPAPSTTQLYDRPHWAKNILESAGWKAIWAAAMVGNLMQEAGPGLTNTAIRGDNGHAHGLGQWQDTAVAGKRYQNLQAFAEKQGKDWTDFETQILFVNHEMHSTEDKPWKAMLNATTIEAAVDAAILYFRPSQPRRDVRLKYARSLL